MTNYTRQQVPSIRGTSICVAESKEMMPYSRLRNTTAIQHTNTQRQASKQAASKQASKQKIELTEYDSLLPDLRTTFDCASSLRAILLSSSDTGDSVGTGRSLDVVPFDSPKTSANAFEEPNTIPSPRAAAVPVAALERKALRFPEKGKLHMFRERERARYA